MSDFFKLFVSPVLSSILCSERGAAAYSSAQTRVSSLACRSRRRRRKLPQSQPKRPSRVRLERLSQMTVNGCRPSQKQRKGRKLQHRRPPNRPRRRPKPKQKRKQRRPPRRKRPRRLPVQGVQQLLYALKRIRRRPKLSTSCPTAMTMYRPLMSLSPRLRGMVLAVPTKNCGMIRVAATKKMSSIDALKTAVVPVVDSLYVY